MSPSSPLLLWQWFFGFSGSQGVPLSIPKRLGIFSLLALFFYGGIWLLLHPLAPLYGKVLSLGLQVVYSSGGKRLLFQAAGLEILFRSTFAPYMEATLSPESVYSNAALLVTLLLVTPGMRPGKRAASLAAGMALLYLSHLLFLITKVEVSLAAINHPRAGNPAFWSFWDDFFEIVGRQLFPIAIWLLLGLRYMTVERFPASLTSDHAPRAAGRINVDVLRGRRTNAGGQSPGRNHPCPCGSGKKYKQCCGK